MRNLAYLLFICVLFSCKTKQHAPVTNLRPDQHIAYPQAEIGSFSKENDAYQLTDVKLNSNYMELTVSYGGGCKEHAFRLIGSPEIKNGVRQLQLVHKSNGDNCKALKEEKLVFAISNLAEHYEPGNKIVLKFENYSHEIAYSYQ